MLRPHPSSRLAAAGATAVLALTALPGAAAARPLDPIPLDPIPMAAPASAEHPGSAGTDWEAIAIGAAGGVAVALLAGGVALGTSGRRRRVVPPVHTRMHTY